MNSKNFTTSIFVTDNNIGIYCLNKKDNKFNVSKNIELDSDVIVNGYIKKPIILYKKLKATFKEIKVLPKELHFVFLGQNILIRELIIEKSKIENQNIKSYIDSQVGISIHFPFDEAAFSYEVKSETEDTIEIIVFIADKNLLEDYYDVLEKIGIKSIIIHLLSTDINHLFNDDKNNILKNTMIVTLLENNITIHIIENGMTVFGMNDECDGTNQGGICSKLEDYIERIANYYQYNLRKDKEKIDNIILINLTTSVDDAEIEKNINTHELGINVIVLNISDINPDLSAMERYANIAYISSVSQTNANDKLLDFKIPRSRRTSIIASYIFVLSVFIFAMISLVYIPWTNMNQEIEDLENINRSLVIQRNMLENNIIYDDNLSSFEITYNNLYSSLTLASISPSDYFLDLLDLKTSDIDILDLKFDDAENKITLVISSDSENNLYEYNIAIYEEYGIILEATATRWMVSAPEATTIATNTMRVVIYYA